eukprot:IDg20908t1
MHSTRSCITLAQTYTYRSLVCIAHSQVYFTANKAYSDNCDLRAATTALPPELRKDLRGSVLPHLLLTTFSRSARVRCRFTTCLPDLFLMKTDNSWPVVYPRWAK